MGHSYTLAGTAACKTSHSKVASNNKSYDIAKASGDKPAAETAHPTDPSLDGLDSLTLRHPYY